MREWNRIRESAISGRAYSADYKQTRNPRIGLHLSEFPNPGKFKIRSLKLYPGYGGKSRIYAHVWYGIESRPIKFNWAMEDDDLWF